MDDSGNYRGGRSGRGYRRGRGGKRGRGGRGRGRGSGRRTARGNSQLQPQGSSDDYVPSHASYLIQHDRYGPGNGYPVQSYVPCQSYQFQENRRYDFPSHLQQEPNQAQSQQLPLQQQHGSIMDEDGRGYRDANMGSFHPPMDNHKAQPPLLQMYQQQFYHPPPLPPQYQQQPPPPQHQYQDESSRYVATLPMPPIPVSVQPVSDYAQATRARQYAYAPIPPKMDVSETQQASYQGLTQSPPPSYQLQQQQRQQPPFSLMPQDPRGDWNCLPRQNQEWQQPLRQQQQFVGVPIVHTQQGLPSRDQHQYENNQVPRFHDRQQSQKQQRTPPSSYICHNCNQSGHWKQHCPLFVGLKDTLGQRYGPGMGPDQQQAFDTGAKPQDPRRNSGAHSDTVLGCAATNKPCEHPPLPDGPAPPLPPTPQLCGNDDTCTQQLPTQPGQQVWRCEPCVKSFVHASQYNAHAQTHVSCSDCDFSASKRVVAAHYETLHGQYSGQGLKEIDVEGQKFMVLVGDSAEDIAKWREERRTKWLAMSRQPKQRVATAQVAGKRKLSISCEEDLEEGEVEEDEAAKASEVAENDTVDIAASPVTALPQGTPDIQKPPVKKQRKTMLCKWFSRGRCRFNDTGCTYSHDRSAFGCRAMMYKGSCSKGMHCPFSHDVAVLLGQRECSQKALKERVIEQQWLGGQKPLLRKLLAKDILVEQHKMLQLVHFLVENEFLQSTTGEEVLVSAKEPAVKTEVVEKDEMSMNVHAEANESIKLVSEDTVMKEALDDVVCKQVGTEELNDAVPYVGEELTTVVADEIVVPIVEASACEEEVLDSTKQDAIVPLQDDEEDARAEAAASELVKESLSRVNDLAASPKAIAVGRRLSDIELVGEAFNSDENAAKKVSPPDNVNVIETSSGTGDVNQVC